MLLYNYYHRIRNGRYGYIIFSDTVMESIIWIISLKLVLREQFAVYDLMGWMPLYARAFQFTCHCQWIISLNMSSSIGDWFIYEIQRNVYTHIYLFTHRRTGTQPNHTSNLTRSGKEWWNCVCYFFLDCILLLLPLLCTRLDFAFVYSFVFVFFPSSLLSFSICLMFSDWIRLMLTYSICQIKNVSNHHTSINQTR